MDKKEYLRQYYLKNKEVIKARTAAWKKANPERKRALNNKWSKENRSKVNAWGRKNKHKRAQYQARWRAKYPDKNAELNRRHDRKHREKRNQKCRDWYSKNKEYNRQRARNWFARNPHKNRLYVNARRARKLNASGSFTVETFMMRSAMWGDACAYCPAPAVAVDHVIPLSRGGTNWPANLRPACKPCNSSKGDKRLSEWVHRPYRQ